MISLFTFGQSYQTLWKKVQEAEDKDLPKTEYEVLEKIVRKASKGKDYGQLLKAELKAAQVMGEISPDSLKPAVQRIVSRAETADNVVLRTVYQTVLYKVSSLVGGLDKPIDCPKLTPNLCEKLAKVKDRTYMPFVVQGVDAGVFGNDLLSVVGYELEAYQPLHDYYVKSGNRRAVCITAAELYRNSSVEELDSLLVEYSDLPEAGELAIHRYECMPYGKEKVGDRVAFIREALGKWGRWKRMDKLRNEEQNLTNPQYNLDFEKSVVMPLEKQTMNLTNLRNLKTLSVKLYRVEADGDLDASPSSPNGYKIIQPLLREVAFEQTRDYSSKPDYEEFDDTMTLVELPAGLYMMEVTTNPSTEITRRLYYVTDVFVISEPLPKGEGVRYVVVSARTGQPLKGAHLRVKEYNVNNKYKTFDFMTDEKGEYIFKDADTSRRHLVFAYTDQDRANPMLSHSDRYSYYPAKEVGTRTCIYTDRSIYRPGQTVRVSALLYEVRNGLEQVCADNRKLTFSLRNANYKTLEQKECVTDEYGVCTTEFTLPTTGVTGLFSIIVNNERVSFRVEEYKRPTFHVDFDEVKEVYAAGDVVKGVGTALSYAGVPVQGARVNYKVMRRTAFWWWSYSRYWNMGQIGYGNNGEEVWLGDAVTGDDGKFEVRIPLQMPETSNPMFYTFVVTADVTDTAGETRTGQLSLPLGNRKTALSVDIPEKIVKEECPEVTFHLYNAAGKDVEGDIRYQIDGGDWKVVKTKIPVTGILTSLRSGSHTLKAVWETDSVERKFVIFSLDDLQPATETHDWFYQSATQFSNDGQPVTIQAGSSDKDVHIVYSIFAGNKIIETGSVDKSNQLFNLKVTYEEGYGNGLLLTFAWVKGGRCYHHNAQIRRPLPDKKLCLSWATFRDKLTPGQKEKWTLTVKDPAGKPADAQLMSVLYDKSLDQIYGHQWSLRPYTDLPTPATSWNYSTYYRVSGSGQMKWKQLAVGELDFSSFDHSVFPQRGYNRFYASPRMLGSAKALSRDFDMMVGAEPMMMREVDMAKVAETADNAVEEEEQVSPEEDILQESQMRENLNETAFFYPQLTTDAKGDVVLRFTIPESLTTWRFLGLAHTKDLFYGSIEAETVARKEVMILPNMPRFIRETDEATIAARIFNTSERNLTGKARLRLIDPETMLVVCEQSQNVSMKAGTTVPVTFCVRPSMLKRQAALLICQMMVQGKDFSDGEQQYLPVLPSTERVMVTRPITQHHPGMETVSLASMVPGDAKNVKVTVEYTNNPEWLMVQALPTLGAPCEKDAVSQAASYYANSIGKHIINRYPTARRVFTLWKEKQGEETSLTSQLEKNQELKDLVLNETPWVLDADREAEQKQRLADFFDENLMQNRLSSCVQQLGKLQKGDGSWTWWEGMPGSFYVTVAVSEMLVRLNTMTGTQAQTGQMLDRAFGFMGEEIVKEVGEMKKMEKEGVTLSFPSFKALEWLYLATLDGRTLPASVQKANDYLLKLLEKDIRSQSLYEKALSAVVLTKSNAARAAEYVQSLKEYTVFNEEKGRYYDSPRAGYSWRDYRIPTQTMAIEALQRIMPDDRQTIEEMQRWLLQEKRTQAWDTPINSVNAVYAFLNGGDRLEVKSGGQSVVAVDGKPVELPKATAAIGYVKTTVPATGKTVTVKKTSDGTSWGAVYAQFTQPSRTIVDSGSGMTIRREILVGDDKSPVSILRKPLAVGTRVRVRITITAERDYDFIQVVDKRAACMEPVRQLSGYRNGYYCMPRDNTTNFYFDVLSKGTHVIENEYFVDRVGTYETGACTVQCAYSPEFRATAKSLTLTID